MTANPLRGFAPTTLASSGAVWRACEARLGVVANELHHDQLPGLAGAERSVDLRTATGRGAEGSLPSRAMQRTPGSAAPSRASSLCCNPSDTMARGRRAIFTSTARARQERRPACQRKQRGIHDSQAASSRSRDRAPLSGFPFRVRNDRNFAAYARAGCAPIRSRAVCRYRCFDSPGHRLHHGCSATAPGSSAHPRTHSRAHDHARSLDTHGGAQPAVS